MTILTQMKIFKNFYWYSKTKQSNLFQNVFRATIILTNKRSKYLPYKFNNWIESLNAEKLKIRHLSRVKDDISLTKIEEKNNQLLIEKIIGAVKKTTRMWLVWEKNSLKLCLKLKKIISYVNVSINPCFLTLQTFLFSIYIRFNLTKSNDLMTIEKQTDERQNKLSKYKILLNFYIFFNFFTILMIVCCWPMDFHQCLIENFCSFYLSKTCFLEKVLKIRRILLVSFTKTWPLKL